MYLFMSRRFRESAISPGWSCRGFGSSRFLVCGSFRAVLAHVACDQRSQPQILNGCRCGRGWRVAVPASGRDMACDYHRLPAFVDSPKESIWLPNSKAL
jgi:hypothetical protein